MTGARVARRPDDVRLSLEVADLPEFLPDAAEHFLSPLTVSFRFQRVSDEDIADPLLATSHDDLLDLEVVAESPAWHPFHRQARPETVRKRYACAGLDLRSGSHPRPRRLHHLDLWRFEYPCLDFGCCPVTEVPVDDVEHFASRGAAGRACPRVPGASLRSRPPGARSGSPRASAQALPPGGRRWTRGTPRPAARGRPFPASGSCQLPRRARAQAPSSPRPGRRGSPGASPSLARGRQPRPRRDRRSRKSARRAGPRRISVAIEVSGRIPLGRRGSPRRALMRVDLPRLNCPITAG